MRQNKTGLVEATVLALQGKLRLNETLDLTINEDGSSVIETEEASVVVVKNTPVMEEPVMEEPVMEESKALKESTDPKLTDDEIVEYLINNYENITGIDIEELRNIDSKSKDTIFNNEVVEKTSDSLFNELDKMGIIGTRLEDILTKLDDKIALMFEAKACTGNKISEVSEPIKTSDNLNETLEGDSYEDVVFTTIENLLNSSSEIQQVTRFSENGTLTKNIGWTVKTKDGVVNLTCDGTYLGESKNSLTESDSYSDKIFTTIENLLNSSDEIKQVTRFSEAGLLTKNIGWVVTTDNGTVNLTCDGTYLGESKNSLTESDSYEDPMFTLIEDILNNSNGVQQVTRFSEAGLLTKNIGWVVTTDEGTIHLACNGTYLSENRHNINVFNKILEAYNTDDFSDEWNEFISHYNFEDFEECVDNIKDMSDEDITTLVELIDTEKLLKLYGKGYDPDDFSSEWNEFVDAYKHKDFDICVNIVKDMGNEDITTLVELIDKTKIQKDYKLEENKKSNSKLNINSFNKILEGYLKETDTNIKTFRVQKLKVSESKIKIRGIVIKENKTREFTNLNFNIIKNGKDFKKYELIENKKLKTESKQTGKVTLVTFNKNKVLECKYIIKK